MIGCLLVFSSKIVCKYGLQAASIILCALISLPSQASVQSTNAWLSNICLNTLTMVPVCSFQRRQNCWSAMLKIGVFFSLGVFKCRFSCYNVNDLLSLINWLINWFDWFVNESVRWLVPIRMVILPWVYVMRRCFCVCMRVCNDNNSGENSTRGARQRNTTWWRRRRATHTHKVRERERIWASGCCSKWFGEYVCVRWLTVWLAGWLACVVALCVLCDVGLFPCVGSVRFRFGGLCVDFERIYFCQILILLAIRIIILRNSFGLI